MLGPTGDDGAAMTTTPSGPDTAVAPRPLTLLAVLSGAAASLGPLVVCLAVGVVGWFLSDAGAHGAPRDGMRTGALAWLMAHGSGVVVEGTVVTLVPWGLTLVVLWAQWRTGHRLGVALAGHGPDADRVLDGERDWTVPTAVTVHTGTYVVLAVLTSSVAGAGAGPSTSAVVVWSVLMGVLVAGAGIAVGSGRAAIWTSGVPASWTAALGAARRIVTAQLLAGLVLVLVMVALNFGTAANMLAQLHTSAGEAVLFILICALLLPNAAVMAQSWMLGPGFVLGTGTVVSPTLVALGPLPAFPLLAAVPGTTPGGWAQWSVAVPFVLTVVVVVRAHLRQPSLTWGEGALRGVAAGVLAGVVLGFVATLAGGAAGPGRMQDVGIPAADVLTHAVTVFGVAGLLAGLATTAWSRRSLLPADDAVEHAD